MNSAISQSVELNHDSLLTRRERIKLFELPTVQNKVTVNKGCKESYFVDKIIFVRMPISGYDA